MAKPLFMIPKVPGTCHGPIHYQAHSDQRTPSQLSLRDSSGYGNFARRRRVLKSPCNSTVE
ncbi:hypothetical protein BPAE_0669g00050 [Botrytis paeoniae]|uniref:Uncharacterized protein n=1 Tax=Botrytis paeoniae TaxID=278948 RepID=A0A4Z1EUQ9_9HELO|nr:hypothetical protein BPAE_0669g00050 [Botrytis paeoniae]